MSAYVRFMARKRLFVALLFMGSNLHLPPPTAKRQPPTGQSIDNEQRQPEAQTCQNTKQEENTNGKEIFVHVERPFYTILQATQ